MDSSCEISGARILVIDDDAELCRLVSRFLGGAGYAVRSTHCGEHGINLAFSGAFDLLILDVMLPGLDGFAILRCIRAGCTLPVLMLTARGDDLDRILGLEIGADDYLAKPFNPHELAARVRAILRRAKMVNAAGMQSSTGPLLIGDVELNAGARAVRCGSHLIRLTTVEFDLLQRLMKSAGRVVGREELTRDVLGREFSPYDRSIDTHVWNLRKKLGLAADGTERSKGIRGIGYLYAVSGREGAQGQ